MPDILPEGLRARLGYPPRGEALIHTHFPEPENLRCLEHVSFTIAAAAHLRGIFLYQLSLALDRKATRKKTPSRSVCGRMPCREALKRICVQPTAAQKRVLAEIAADLTKTCPMNRLLQATSAAAKTIIALQAAVIANRKRHASGAHGPHGILAAAAFPFRPPHPRQKQAIGVEIAVSAV